MGGMIDVDYEIENNPDKKVISLDLKKTYNRAAILYSKSLVRPLRTASLDGSTLTLCAETNEGKEYTIKLNNVVSTSQLEVFEKVEGTTVTSGSFVNFYNKYANTIEWFPSDGSNSKAKGTYLHDTINAASFYPSSSSSSQGVVIDGAEGNDSIIGSDLNDKLLGGAGNDTLIGGAGNDSITGGTGNNVYVFEDEPFGSDTILPTKNEIMNVSIQGGKCTQDTSNKNDLIVYNDYGQVAIKDVLGKDTGAEIFVNGKNVKEEALLAMVSVKNQKNTGTMIADIYDATKYSSTDGKGVTIDTRAGNDTIIGSDSNDKLIGGDGDDSLIGLEGNDSIYGGKGNDTIGPGDGSNYVSGGDGDDVIISSGGNDTVVGGTGRNKVVYNDKLYPVGNTTIILTKDEELTIEGLTEENLEYDSKNKKDLIINVKGENGGKITIKDFLNKDIGAEVIINGKNLKEKAVVKANENDLLQSTEKGTKVIQNYTGSSIADVIDASKIGTSITLEQPKGFTLNGGGGCDSISGSGYDDKLYGGAGNDTLIGGAGNDSITGGTGNNVYIFEDESFGFDTILPTKNEIMNVSIQGGQFTQDTSNKNDLIVENDHGGQVTIKGVLGKDTGAEIIINGKNVKEEAVLKPVDSSHFVDSETHKLKNNKYTGTAIADVIDASSITSSITQKGLTLDGGAGNDSIVGSWNSDKLLGGDGNDTLIGGAGNDSITGGTGNNVYIFEDKPFGFDTILPTKNETMNVSIQGGKYTQDTSNKNDLIVYNDYGQVTIKNILTKDIGAEVFVNGENLKEKAVLGVVGGEYFNPSSGKANSKYTGTTLADVIDASSAKNAVTIDGGAGNDFIVGSWNSDKLLGGAGDDTIFGGNGYGSSTITGGLGDDVIKGSSGENKYIVGLGHGNDSIIGGGYNDSIVFDKDTKVEVGFGNDGNDLLIEYSGVANKKEVSNTITVKDYAEKLNIQEIVVGKTSKSLDEYLAENNVHSVGSFDKDTSVKIREAGGCDDVLNINASANDVRAIINVNKDGSYDKLNTNFVHKDVLSGENALDAFANLLNGSSTGLGVNVEDSSSSGIEKVNFNGSSVETNAWYNKVAQEVSAWLSGTSYNSTLDAINAYNEDPSGVNISGLIGAYDGNYANTNVLT